ncbi:MAG TPA: cache domain-containing protein, partial [Anaerolineales bacterium]|nr:cache domain-containing protein [Anaerolineales bacterium]
FWDARNMLTRSSNGSWDNLNSENRSIFISSRTDLPDAIVSELNILKQVDFIAPPLLLRNPNILAIYFGSVEGETVYYPNIDLAAILPPDFNIAQRPWFTAAEVDQNPQKKIVWSVPYQDAALNGLVITSSVPIYDFTDKFRGVVAMDVKLEQIAGLVSKIHIGKTGYAFLIDNKGRVIGMPDAGYTDFGLSAEQVLDGESLQQSLLESSPIDVFQILVKMTTGQSSLRSITFNGVEKYVVYRPVPSVGYSLGLVVPKAEMNEAAIAISVRVANEAAGTLRNTVLIIGAVLAFSLLVSLWIGNTITLPLAQLTYTAQKIAGGDMNATATAQSRDEIGILASTLNTMTEKLRELISSLEHRVAERTTDLEIARHQSEKRAGDLQAIGEISKIITGEQKLDYLLPLITRLVSEQFGFYHTGIFLLDDTKQFAVLQAANSAGGKNMLKRGHMLEVGGTGIVGYVAKIGTARIALDVGLDAVFFNNPDLPDTRSEMALPLKVRDQIVGVLDVQSEKPGIFTENDANTLSILADQIAIAIENARLNTQTQRALNEAQTLNRQNIQESWLKFSKEESSVGYSHSIKGGKKLSTLLETDEIREAMNRGKVMVFDNDGKNQQPSIVVPIKLRGQIIGALNIKAPTQDRRWSVDEVNLAEAISERLSLALENARLFEETTRRAERERIISDISTKIGTSVRTESILRTTASELSNLLDGADVYINLGSNEKER